MPENLTPITYACAFNRVQKKQDEKHLSLSVLLKQTLAGAEKGNLLHELGAIGAEKRRVGQQVRLLDNLVQVLFQICTPLLQKFAVRPELFGWKGNWPDDRWHELFHFVAKSNKLTIATKHFPRFAVQADAHLKHHVRLAAARRIPTRVDLWHRNLPDVVKRHLGGLKLGLQHLNLPTGLGSKLLFTLFSLEPSLFCGFCLGERRLLYLVPSCALCSGCRSLPFSLFPRSRKLFGLCGGDHFCFLHCSSTSGCFSHGLVCCLLCRKFHGFDFGLPLCQFGFLFLALVLENGCLFHLQMPLCLQRGKLPLFQYGLFCFFLLQPELFETLGLLLTKLFDLQVAFGGFCFGFGELFGELLLLGFALLHFLPQLNRLGVALLFERRLVKL
eukprot:m.484754 g.484754  ORF g.484754 m.484754 type:complete len:386 (-) comp23533_c0_seq1:2232-3389(-)